MVFQCIWFMQFKKKCQTPALDAAAGTLSMSALDIICDPKLLRSAKAEWEERMNGRTYQCLLEDEMTPPIDLNRDVMEKYK